MQTGALYVDKLAAVNEGAAVDVGDCSWIRGADVDTEEEEAGDAAGQGAEAVGWEGDGVFAGGFSWWAESD
jgi:hypothetical protein